MHASIVLNLLSPEPGWLPIFPSAVTAHHTSLPLIFFWLPCFACSKTLLQLTFPTIKQQQTVAAGSRQQAVLTTSCVKKDMRLPSTSFLLLLCFPLQQPLETMFQATTTTQHNGAKKGCCSFLILSSHLTKMQHDFHFWQPQFPLHSNQLHFHGSATPNFCFPCPNCSFPISPSQIANFPPAVKKFLVRWLWKSFPQGGSQKVSGEAAVGKILVRWLWKSFPQGGCGKVFCKVAVEKFLVRRQLDILRRIRWI